MLIFRVNLAVLLSGLIETILGHYGRNLDGVKESTIACTRALDFAQYVMCSRIGSAVFSVHATQFGHPDIAAYLDRFSSIKSDEEEKLVRTICEFRADQYLAHVGMNGDRSSKIVDQRVYVPVENDTDKTMLQMTCTVDELIPSFHWYSACVPQILARSLQRTAFRDAKPLYELEYVVGLSPSDYRRIGFA